MQQREGLEALKQPGEEFWTIFVNRALADWFSTDLANQLVEACKESNIYALYTLVNLTALFSDGCQYRADYSTSPLGKLA